MNKHLLWALIAVLLTGQAAFGENARALTVGDLRCEYREKPLGIDNTKPRRSWKLVDANHQRGQKQTSDHMLVASSLEFLAVNRGELWDSGAIADEESVNLVYE